MHKFRAELKIIGINPYVPLPDKILKVLFKTSGRDKGPIPIHGLINSKPYKQTLVKYRGDWRFYINMIMLPKSPQRIGEILEITISFDPVDRQIVPHPKLVNALKENKEAKAVFDKLPPSRRKEIIRYISALKTEESINKNISRAIAFLTGKERFVGRDKP
jgi:hypothetical protein